LEKEPARRFATAHEFALALLDVIARQSEPRIGEPTVSLSRPPSEPSLELHPLAATARGRNRGRMIAAIAAGALALGVVAAVVATRGGDEAPPTSVPAAPAPVVTQSPTPPAAVKPDAGAELVSRATELGSAGQRDRAIDLLVKARKTYPDDARLPYTLAKLYLEKMWWADGLKQARAALALDPKLRTDPELIKLAVRGFNTTKRYDGTLARFLRDDIGDAAKPYIQDTAEHHPNPIVRARANSELRRYR
jgi:hypothetical protein